MEKTTWDNIYSVDRSRFSWLDDIIAPSVYLVDNILEVEELKENMRYPYLRSFVFDRLSISPDFANNFKGFYVQLENLVADISKESGEDYRYNFDAVDSCGNDFSGLVFDLCKLNKDARAVYFKPGEKYTGAYHLDTIPKLYKSKQNRMGDLHPPRNTFCSFLLDGLPGKSHELSKGLFQYSLIDDQFYLCDFNLAEKDNEKKA